jgi:signal transduction histidine kinase
VAAAIEAACLPAGVRVQIEKLDDLPPVVAGKQSLALVFANLLENAADAMQGNGTIVIQGATHDDRVQVAVSDDGPGIAPELHGRIFEFNFSGSAAPRPGKLGFGLWWVKTLMARLGGSVTVESDGRSGTKFRLGLPRAEKML